MNYEKWNFAVALIALVVALYANYQVYRQSKSKITVSGAQSNKFNKIDPFMLSFTINNHSTNSLQILNVSFYSDKKYKELILPCIDLDLNAVGWDPPEVSYSSNPFTSSLTFPKFNYVHFHQYSNEVKENQVLHSNSSLDCSYYLESNYEYIYIKIRFDRRVGNFFRKEYKTVLKIPKVDYSY